MIKKIKLYVPKNSDKHSLLPFIFKELWLGSNIEAKRQKRDDLLLTQLQDGDEASFENFTLFKANHTHGSDYIKVSLWRGHTQILFSGQVDGESEFAKHKNIYFIHPRQRKSLHSDDIDELWPILCHNQQVALEYPGSINNFVIQKLFIT